MKNILQQEKNTDEMNHLKIKENVSTATFY